MLIRWINHLLLKINKIFFGAPKYPYFRKKRPKMIRLIGNMKKREVGGMEMAIFIPDHLLIVLS